MTGVGAAADAYNGDVDADNANADADVGAS